MSLNLLSMMGLMLGVGMLVDNAIVMAEAIDRSRSQGLGVVEAVSVGGGQVTTAVVASTLTSVVVFLPLVLGGTTNLTVWLREVGITISLSLGCSLLASLTLIPLASRWLLGSRRLQTKRASGRLERMYKRAIAWALARPKRTLALATTAFIVGCLPAFVGGLDSSVYSAQATPRLALQYEFHDFHYARDVNEVVKRVEQYIEQHRETWGVSSVYSYLSSTPGRHCVGAQRRRQDHR